MKNCSKCKQIKNISEFHKDRGTKDSLRGWCKACDKAYQQSKKGKVTIRKASAKYLRTPNGKAAMKRFHAHNPNHLKAHNAVNHAIRAGRLPRPDSRQCLYCPEQAEQYHHYKGYEPEHWLDVVPACVECHTKADVKNAKFI